MSRSAFSGLALLMLSYVCCLDGQTGAASLQGTVRDASSATVPSSRVSALRIDTGRQYDTTTNEAASTSSRPWNPASIASPSRPPE